MFSPGSLLTQMGICGNCYFESICIHALFSTQLVRGGPRPIFTFFAATDWTAFNVFRGRQLFSAFISALREGTMAVHLCFRGLMCICCFANSFCQHWKIDRPLNIGIWNGFWREIQTSLAHFGAMEFHGVTRELFVPPHMVWGYMDEAYNRGPSALPIQQWRTWPAWSSSGFPVWPDPPICFDGNDSNLARKIQKIFFVLYILGCGRRSSICPSKNAFVVSPEMLLWESHTHFLLTFEVFEDSETRTEREVADWLGVLELRFFNRKLKAPLQDAQRWKTIKWPQKSLDFGRQLSLSLQWSHAISAQMNKSEFVLTRRNFMTNTSEYLWANQR